MLDQLKRLLKYAKEADYAEIGLRKDDSMDLSVQKDKFKSIDSVNLSNVFVKVWIGKRKGIATSNKLDEEVVKKAITLAKNSKQQEFFYGIPSKQKYKHISLFNEMPSEKEMVEIAKNVVKIISDKEKRTYGSCILSANIDERFLVNSEGIEAEEKKSTFAAQVEVFAKKNGKITNYDDILTERSMDPPEIMNLANSTKKEVLALLERKPLRKKISTVVLYPLAFYELIDNAFLSNFNAMNVVKKRSILTEKLGQQVLDKKISLNDNGCMPSGFLSANFDWEGIPTGNTTLIDKGILKNFVNNYNLAKHLKVQPTGNATFSGVSFNNILVKSGKKNILDELENALLVKAVLGANTANEITTAFSVKTNTAYLLENGKIQAVNDVMLSGKFIKSLQNVVTIDNKTKNVEGFYLPAIALKGIDVTY